MVIKINSWQKYGIYIYKPLHDQMNNRNNNNNWTIKFFNMTFNIMIESKMLKVKILREWKEHWQWNMHSNARMKLINCPFLEWKWISSNDKVIMNHYLRLNTIALFFIFELQQIQNKFLGGDYFLIDFLKTKN